MSHYNDQNVFAKILREELPIEKIAEDEYTLVFYDAYPKVKTHVLIIPKKPYMSFQDFSEKGTPEEILSFTRMVGQVARDLGLNETGYRLLSNHGADAGQEVPHFHVHLCGGERLGPLLSACQ